MGTPAALAGRPSGFARLSPPSWTRLALAFLVAGTASCGEAGTEPDLNGAPQPVGSILSRTIVEGESAQVNAASHFSDPDGDPLTYTATSSNSGVASTSVAGGVVTVTGVAPGSASVTVTARDPSGLTANQSFQVTVETANRTPEAVFDSLMSQFTEQYGIGAAALGIMRDGDIVYEGAIGFMDPQRQVPIAHNVMMRLASVSKPITAAAVRELAAERRLSLNDRVFDLGQAEGGLIELAPFPSLGDQRLAEITVLHLLQHRGGWDRDIAGDLVFREIEIADAMSIPSPPGRENTVRYILGQPLQFDPGARRAYSNIGYLVLGLVIEEVSGQDYMTYVHENIFAPLGVPAEDVIRGRTFPEDRSDREPWYDASGTARNVFDPSGPRVRWADGGWDLEAKIAEGGLVAATRAILEFLDTYRIFGNDIGTRRRGSEGPGWWWYHTGSLSGTNTMAHQRGNGINYVVLFNRRPSTDPSYAELFRERMDALLAGGGIEWPGPAMVASEWNPQVPATSLEGAGEEGFSRANVTPAPTPRS